jgi:hypothetical protein
VKTYVAAAVETLRKKGKTRENRMKTQFGTKELSLKVALSLGLLSTPYPLFSVVSTK